MTPSPDTEHIRYCKDNGIYCDCEIHKEMSKGYSMTAHISPTENTEELGYNPRQYGKSFKQWQQFIAYSKAGEDIAYRTPEGDICSPARVAKLIDQAVQAFGEKVLEEQFGMYNDYHDTVDVVPVSVITSLMRKDGVK